MEQEDLKERIYQYYQMIRHELNGAVASARLNKSKDKADRAKIKRTPQQKMNAKKWHSKGH